MTQIDFRFHTDEQLAALETNSRQIVTISHDQWVKGFAQSVLDGVSAERAARGA